MFPSAQVGQIGVIERSANQATISDRDRIHFGR
jgi:hypothetical protein